MTYKHFLITRFNLRMVGKTTDSDREAEIKWLDHRFELFEQYCLPSVAKQVCQDFTWLIFFDITTPEEYQVKVEVLSREYPNISPVYIDGASRYNDACIREVLSRLAPEDEYVITSRIDNDDAIHQDYVSSIQSCFSGQDYCYIDCIKGRSLLLDSKVLIADIEKRFNPFSSLIERHTSSITTVSTRNHDHWQEVEDIIEIDHKALWLQVIHDNNITNRFGHSGYLTRGGYLTDDYAGTLDEFNILIDLNGRKTGRGQILYYNVRLFFRHLIHRSFERLKRIIKAMIGRPSF